MNADIELKERRKAAKGAGSDKGKSGFDKGKKEKKNFSRKKH